MKNVRISARLCTVGWLGGMKTASIVYNWASASKLPSSINFPKRSMVARTAARTSAGRFAGAGRVISKLLC